MEHESELTINADLPKALGVALVDGAEPTPELVLAACLQQLTVRNGLAQRDDPAHSSVRSANLPAPALALLDLYFGADGKPASDDAVRNGLCEVLGYLSTKPGALKAVNKARPLTGEDFLVFAQIYWNLDAEAPRGVLPIAAGQKLSTGKKAYIKVDGADEDYAQLELKQRASRTPGYSRAGGAFYVRGARVAALVAKRLVATHKYTAGAAELRSTRTGRGVEWSIVWPAAQPSAETPVAAEAEPDAPARHIDPTIATLRQLRQKNLADGKLSEAAFLCTALLSILQDRSEKNPGDDEPQLADEYLRTGLTYGVAGRAEEALDHCVKAERAFQTLHELTPGESTYRLELAVSRTMIGAFHLQAARVDDAEAALVDAVALSQELTDEDARNEDMLAASLSVLGLVYVQSGRPEDAIKILTRAVTIAQKIATQDPSDDAKQLQLANTLTTLGMLHLQAGDNQRAEEDLVRSLAAGEELAARDPKDRMTRLLVASDQAMLGMIWLFSDRYEDAENALTAAVALAQELIKQHRDEAAQLTLAGALHTGGLLCMVTDRLQEAESRFAAAVTVSRDLIALGQNGLVSSAQKTRASTFLGSSLYFLGVIYVELEREEAAEEVLVEALRVFERRQHDEADQKMLADTLEALSDLFEEQGRSVDAQRTRERRRGLDDSNPETPAPA